MVSKESLRKGVKSDRTNQGSMRINEQELVKNIQVKMYLEGNTKEDALVAVDPAGRPSWFNNQFYFFMTLLCMGWIIRLYMYVNTVNVNYYLKKLIIK